MHTADAVLVVIAGAVLAIGGLLYALVRLGRLQRVYTRLTRGASGGTIEAILAGYMDQVSSATQRLGAVELVVEEHGKRLDTCLQGVGVVRFDAFDDVGGQQSFALVALDRQRNGFALSSIYSRTDLRIYVKPIANGHAAHPLTEEERRALQAAERR